MTKDLFSVISFIFYFLSAIWWYRSTKVKISFVAKCGLEKPEHNLAKNLTFIDIIKINFCKRPIPTGIDDTIKQSSAINCLAAIWAALGALSSTLSIFLSQ